MLARLSRIFNYGLPNTGTLLTLGRRYLQADTSVAHLMLDGYPELYPSMRNCPYVEGNRLYLSFSSENEPDRARPLEVEVEKPFLPFTSSQALLVKNMTPEITALPSRFVLKLQDRRFRMTFTYGHPYDPSVYPAMRKGLYAIIHENARPNPFHELGGTDQIDCDERPPWMDHVRDWFHGLHSHTSEVEGYRKLRPFQGRIVPRMYGTARYHLRQPTDIEDPPGFIHPALDSVDGLALEYIDGPSADTLEVGVNISQENADRVAHATFAALREIRNFKVCHNDLRSANVLVRHNDYDHPFILDWSGVLIKSSDMTDEEWDYGQPYSQVEVMRRFFADRGLHMPSPYPRWCLREHPKWGYRSLNSYATKLRPDWRDKLFEPIEIYGPEFVKKMGDDGVEYDWEPAKWRPRQGIRYAPDRDLDRV